MTESKTQGRVARELSEKLMAERFAYYKDNYGVIVKEGGEHSARFFFDQGYADGVTIGIELGRRAAFGIPIDETVRSELK